MKAFITSQFSYCTLIWIFYSKKLNNMINKIKETVLILLYQDAEQFDQYDTRNSSDTTEQFNQQDTRNSSDTTEQFNQQDRRNSSDTSLSEQ